jgi:hypothetical protein
MIIRLHMKKVTNLATEVKKKYADKPGPSFGIKKSSLSS